MRIRVDHRDITWLAVDQAEITMNTPKGIKGVIQQDAKEGGLLARANAKNTAGKHGKWYPAAITWDRGIGTGAAFGTLLYHGEYGPDPSKRQGAMSFENGSRNQPPHNDLAKSADVIGPKFLHDIDELVGGWFGARNRTGR